MGGQGGFEKVIYNGVQDVRDDAAEFRVQFQKTMLGVLYGFKATKEIDVEKLNTDQVYRLKVLSENNFFRDPSIFSFNNSVIWLNSRDLCNPFTFLLEDVLDDDNFIAKTYRELDKIARIWTAISSGNFLGGGTIDRDWETI